MAVVFSFIAHYYDLLYSRLQSLISTSILFTHNGHRHLFYFCFSPVQFLLPLLHFSLWTLHVMASLMSCWFKGLGKLHAVVGWTPARSLFNMEISLYPGHLCLNLRYMFSVRCQKLHKSLHESLSVLSENVMLFMFSFPNLIPTLISSNFTPLTMSVIWII